MEKERNDDGIALSQGIVIRCSKTAFMLSSMRSSLPDGLAAERNNLEMEGMRRSIEELKAALAEERSKRRESAEYARLLLTMLINLVFTIVAFAMLLTSLWVRSK
ncbi:uncharacterized protein LOC120282618 [Dioscorea cayenensis subsp. rotundata]|uniref:Uncharacterized protein LOC120282618 n=1 Tax=Dioscorea cayennensis subsp. rotundata TaxID=55577 RepID=A0AB40CZE5_DIOCR|nr:uncharacterized protein LOC120282618 [Dioscorea cayenensis subsp. rotundata]